jgi:hypothetical protein
MRADAIQRLIEKLNALQAIEALKAQPSEELPVELPELPDEAAGEIPGRPDIVPVSQPEQPDLPEQAIGGASGRPEPVPHSRPELPPTAVEFCKETGLPMVAMADHRDEDDSEESDAELYV